MNLRHLTPSQLLTLRARLEARRIMALAVPGARSQRLLPRCQAALQRLPRPQCSMCPPWACQPAATLVEGSPACERCAESVAEEDARRALERASRARRVEDAGRAADLELERRKDSDDPIHHQE